jgi:hypothetical protein
MTKYDIGLKKSVHFNLTKDGHTAFRVACINRGLSMQEVIEAFVQKILNENSNFLKFLDEVKENKKLKINKKYSSSDIKSIYDILEKEDPLKEM